jgi:hypothetical protein
MLTKIPNPKTQITNKFQCSNFEIPTRFKIGVVEIVLNPEIYDLLVFYCWLFEIFLRVKNNYEKN